MGVENADMADLYQTYFGCEPFHNNCINCILVAHELHNIWRLLGNFGDYLAFCIKEMEITELFRSGFGYGR